MKNYIYSILVLTFVLALSSCKEKEDVDLITINNTEWTLGADGDKLSVEVNSTSDWTVSKDAAWVTLSKKSGLTGQEEIVVRAGENLSGVERKATITFTSAKSQATLVVTQARNLVLDLEAPDYIVGAEGGVLNVNLSSNLDYAITIEGGDGWISEVKSKAGIENLTHQFKIEENKVKEARTATVKFTDAKEKVEKSIVISQRPMPDKFALTYTGDSLMSPVIYGAGSFAIVKWGDNTTDSIFAREPLTHNYQKEGTYNVSLAANYMESFLIQDLVGISELDLSDFVTE